MSERQLSLFDPIEIPLTQGYVALVDPCDADLVMFNWISQVAEYTVYAFRTVYREGKYSHKEYLHHIVLERKLGRRVLPADEKVDHKDLNGLNNRRSNLRSATNSESTANQRIRSDNTSGVKGVYWDKRREKWCAEIVCGKKIYLGRFNDFEEARNVRHQAEQMYFGEFARTE